jgi:DedD protein
VSSALQNRLVGTIILVAIAVIFLPDLLDGKKESKQNLFVELPPKPNIEKVVAPDSFDSQTVKEGVTRKVEIVNDEALDDKLIEQNESLIEQDSTTQQELAAQQANVAPSALAQATVVDDKTPKSLASAGWVVQLGSFSHQKNVRELLTLLEKSGYRAFSRQVQTSSGLLTKVFVGPDLQKDKLDKALSHLKEITALQGRVTPFTVQ